MLSRRHRLPDQVHLGRLGPGGIWSWQAPLPSGPPTYIFHTLLITFNLDTEAGTRLAPTISEQASMAEAIVPVSSKCAAYWIVDLTAINQGMKYMEFYWIFYHLPPTRLDFEVWGGLRLNAGVPCQHGDRPRQGSINSQGPPPLRSPHRPMRSSATGTVICFLNSNSHLFVFHIANNNLFSDVFWYPSIQPDH